MSLLRAVILTTALLPVAAVAADDAKPMVKKHMKPAEPMAGEMKKPGMKQGDVKKAAEKKDKQMKEPMKQEQSKMK